MLLQLIIVQLVTFLAIVFVLRKFLYSESVKETNRLRKLKEESLIKQRELQEKIDQAQAAFDQKIADAENGARELSAKAEAEAKELRDKILEKAKEDAGNIMKAAFNAKEKMREEIAVEMMQKAPIFASHIFSAVLSADVKELTHKELIKDVIERIKHLDKATFKAPVDHGEILSAHALSGTDQAEIESAIRLGLGYKVPLAEKKDDKITAGLVVRLGSIIIDGSLENRMRQAEREITESLSMGREQDPGDRV